MSKTNDTSKPGIEDVEAFTHDLGGIGYKAAQVEGYGNVLSPEPGGIGYKTAAAEGWGNVVSPEPGGIGYKAAQAEGLGNVASPEPGIWIYDLGGL